MYIRTTRRRNKDGSVVEYVQLAHNEWDSAKGQARARVLYSFGRRDRLDLDALRRLVRSLGRFLPAEEALQLQGEIGGDAGLRFVGSRASGGAHLLRGLWDRLRIDETLSEALANRDFTAPIRSALFAMVANRALAPSSKLAVERWAERDVWLGRDDSLQVQHFYRAMDFLLEHAEAVQKAVFWSTANLLNLEVDLIFFDTTNTWFEIEDAEDSELKFRGKSKENRNDLPLVTVGLAVTREGLPVRCWVLPGNQSDAKAVERVQRDMNEWRLGRVLWVMDRGMTGEENRRILRRAGGHYILGEKLRGVHLNEEAPRRPGRFKKVSDRLQVKEVFVGEGAGRRRFVLAFNPRRAAADRKRRERLKERLAEKLAAVEAGNASKAKLLNHPHMGRFVRERKNGTLAMDKGRLKEREKLDGKFLLSTSDDGLSAEDVALGYKQLLEVERAFRTLKTSLNLRPVHHSRDDRIRSHVLLCWLALLLVRLAEIETGETWPRLRDEMQRLHLGEFAGKDGRVLKHSEPTSSQINILKKLKIKPPKPVLDVKPAP